MGEGPGQNEDQQGRPFVGAAGGLLDGAHRRPSAGGARRCSSPTSSSAGRPGNRDPEPDEMAACAPFLRRQLEVLDPALVVTLGRFSLGTFMPGARIGQVAWHGPPGGPRDRRPRRRRVRHVSPGRGVPPDGAQGDDARRHVADPRRAHRGASRPGRRRPRPTRRPSRRPSPRRDPRPRPMPTGLDQPPAQPRRSPSRRPSRPASAPSHRSRPTPGP